MLPRSSERLFRRATLVAAALAGALGLSGCFGVRYDPTMASKPYPAHLHTTKVIDVQVFHEGETILLVNATLNDFESFKLWLNQRFRMDVESLPAGGRVRLPLNRFWDEWGGGPNPGGIFRRYEPTPIRLAEIEGSDEQPMVGLICIPTETEIANLSRREDE